MTMPEKLQDLLKTEYVYENKLIRLADRWHVTSEDIQVFKKIYTGRIIQRKETTSVADAYLSFSDKQNTEDENIALIKRYRRWDTSALWMLIEGNMGFVVYRAKSYIWKGIEFADLIGEWVIWLKKAIDLFDITRWIKLSTYACSWIDQAIMKALADYKYNVRLPTHVTTEAVKINKAQLDFFQKHWRYMTPMEILENVDVTEKTMNAIEWVQSSFSIDKEVWWEWGSTYGDFIEDTDLTPEEAIAHKLQHESLTKIIEEALTPQETKMIHMRFWLNWHAKMTLEEICSEFWVSRERARQVIERSIIKLRTNKQLSERYWHEEIMRGRSKTYWVDVSSTWVVKWYMKTKTMNWYIVSIQKSKKVFEDVFVHDLVAEVFCGFKPWNIKHYVQHKNCDIFDNRMENLYVGK